MPSRSYEVPEGICAGKCQWMNFSFAEYTFNSLLFVNSPFRLERNTLNSQLPGKDLHSHRHGLPMMGHVEVSKRSVHKGRDYLC